MHRLKVRDHTALVRDTRTGAIINTDSETRLAYRNKFKVAKEKQEEVQSLKEQVAELKKDISEIKKMLFSISTNFTRY